MRGRISRVVLVPGMLAPSPAEAFHPTGVSRIESAEVTGATEHRLPGESTKDTVPTIRAGKAGMFRHHLWSTPCAFFLHAGSWVPAGARPSLRPLFQEGEESKQSSGETRRENTKVCLMNENAKARVPPGAAQRAASSRRDALQSRGPCDGALRNFPALRRQGHCSASGTRGIGSYLLTIFLALRLRPFLV